MLSCIILSLENLENESLRLAKKIDEDFSPDVVIYVARGGYLIGETIAGYFKVKNIGIHAERDGGTLKELISPLLICLPKWIKMSLRKMELASGLHKGRSNRKIYWDDDAYLKIKNMRKILVVDDSVDTGLTMVNVIQEIQKKAGAVAIIKTAAINVWSDSIPIVQTDYFNYKNTIIQTPMSKDSKEYPIFESIYKDRKNKSIGDKN